MMMNAPGPAMPARWELYRLLSEPVRLRLLALAAEEELAIGELADLLREGQPNVSRHVAPLKKAGLLAVRKQGTRVLVRVAEAAEGDPVVADGLRAGRALCEADGSLVRVHELVEGRDASSREFFGSAPRDPGEVSSLPAELPAYLSALAPLIRDRALAVDVGSGSGPLLDVLAPLFRHVVAVDRAAVQLERARERMRCRGYTNVSLVEDAYDSEAVRRLVLKRGGADAVFASRVLHHAPKPGAAVGALARLLKPGGALVVIDYVAHENETMREEQADLWLGFSAAELVALAQRAGLSEVSVRPIPAARCGDGPDAGVSWHCLVARQAPDRAGLETETNRVSRVSGETGAEK